MRPFFTFQTLILWMIAPLLLVLSVISGCLIYESATKTILTGFDRKLITLSGSLAALMDVEAHKAYQSQRKLAASVATPAVTSLAPAAPAGDAGLLSEQDPFYLRYQQPMTDVWKAAHLTFFYTYVYLGDDKIFYVLDGTVGPTHSPAGSLDTLPDAAAVEGNQEVQYLKRRWVSDIKQWEQWGLLKSASYPMISASGETVAIAGADVDITIIKDKTHWILFAVLVTCVSFLLAASFVSLRIARSLIRPLRSLKETALRIASGNYRSGSDSGSSRETASLARTLGTLGKRLSEQQTRNRTYQEKLHHRQRHTTLARALAVFTAKYTITDQSSSRLPKSATGNCWRGLDGVFWHGPTLDNEVIAACHRAQLTYLGRQLLAAPGSPEDVPSEMLASDPTLLACARWHTASRRLYYSTRQASWLWIGTSLKSLNGTGYLDLPSDEHFEWSEEGPEGFEVTETKEGELS